MSQWDKLINKLMKSSKDMRFEELQKILESYGYDKHETGSGSSHCTFRKKGHKPVTIPRHNPIKRIYIELVKAIVEEEEA